MGRMIDGTWDRRDSIPADERGAFQRASSHFRNTVQPEDVEAGRYHLYVSLACPWAHRTLITRALLGLDDAISVSTAEPFMGDDGWKIGDEHLWQVYARAQANYTGRVTVPVLWDRKTKSIVNNESREIVRMFATVFRPLWTRERDLSPSALHPQIAQAIDANYNTINNGVYRSGFAKKQEAYDEAVGELFAALDRCEATLSTQRYLCGSAFTEADICLFPSLFRFDLVYHTHFKCNVRRLIDYPNLWGYTRDIYALDGVAATCSREHIKAHYYGSHESINPYRIVPAGPDIDFELPHDRARL